VKVLQHYYTSYTNEQSGSAGFQVKGISPGISPDLQSTITRLIAYRIPPVLNERAIATHPIALRYFYKNSQEAIFLCSQSNGSDENGRPGNFFAHTVVMEPDLFTAIPPILYWKSPFWQVKDTTNPARVSVLPVLENFDADPPLDIDDMWSFLAHGKRRETLYKLMCAVVHSSKTRRRIIILDSTENVVWWIASLSAMLPPDYRPFLTFATYHHDPYQAQYLITGITSDSAFRLSSEEYFSFFIFNAETDETSNVDDSSYARLVYEMAEPDLYGSTLLPIFTKYVGRFPAPVAIDEQIDLMAEYANLQMGHGQTRSKLHADELQAIEVALASLEHLRVYEEDDIDELRRLRPLLWDAYKAQEDLAVYAAHIRVMGLLKQHAISTDEYILDELKYFTQQLLQQQTQVQSFASFNNLRQTYGDDIVGGILNRSAYLQWLTHYLRQVSFRQLCVFWQYIGASLQPAPLSQEILTISLSKVDKLLSQKRFDDATELLDLMWRAMGNQQQRWLKLAVNANDAVPANALNPFYYKLVHPLALDSRVPYRNMVLPVSRDIIFYELNGDIRNARVEGGIAALETWVQYAQKQGYDTQQLVTHGLRQLQRMCSSQQWSALASQILTNRRLAPLSANVVSELVPLALSTISLARFSTVDVELCRQYYDHEAVSENDRLLIDGILAVVGGKLDTALARRMHTTVKILSLEDYKETVNTCIPMLLQQEIPRETQCLMFDAFFTWSYSVHFWYAYWDAFSSLLLNLTTVERAYTILAFWFDVIPAEFQHRYIIQKFFLDFPIIMENMSRNRGFQQAALAFTELAINQAWYPGVQDFFIRRKNALTTLGQNLFTKLRGLRDNQRSLIADEEKEQAEREAQFQRLKDEIEGLFDKKQAIKSHEQIASLYDFRQREQFWTLYWNAFTPLLTRQDADLILAILSFWCDESFKVCRQAGYICQEFFLGLPNAIELARKERGFRDTARAIVVKAEHDPKHYPCYGLVGPLFVR